LLALSVGVAAISSARRFKMKITADILEQAREALVDATNQKIALISAIK
jgi:hypothetical protein